MPPKISLLRKWESIIHDVLQKRFGFDVISFAKSSTIVSVPLFLQRALGLLVVILFTRFMDQDSLGEYQFFLSIIGVFYLFALSGIDTAVCQSVSKGHYRSVLDAPRLRFLTSLLGSAGFLCITFYLLFLHYAQTAAWQYYLIAAFLFPFFFSFGTVYPYLQGMQRFKRFALYHSLFHLVTYLGIASAVFFTQSMVFIVLAYLSLTSLTSVYFYFRTVREDQNRIKKSKKDKNLYKYGFHLTLIEVIPLISSHADKIILPFYLSFEQLAIYTIALSLPSQIGFLVKPLLRILLPKLSSIENDVQAYSLLRKNLIPMILLSLGLALVGFLLTPFILPFLFTTTYSASIVYSQVLFAAFIFTIPAQTFYQFLLSRMQTRSIFKVNSINDSLKLILLLILIPLFGIWGVVLTLILRNYIFFFSSFYLSFGVYRKAMANRHKN